MQKMFSLPPITPNIQHVFKILKCSVTLHLNTIFSRICAEYKGTRHSWIRYTTHCHVRLRFGVIPSTLRATQIYLYLFTYTFG